MRADPSNRRSFLIMGRQSDEYRRLAEDADRTAHQSKSESTKKTFESIAHEWRKLAALLDQSSLGADS
jgi:hypothetical protein